MVKYKLRRKRKSQISFYTAYSSLQLHTDNIPTTHCQYFENTFMHYNIELLIAITSELQAYSSLTLMFLAEEPVLSAPGLQLRVCV
jgi:hypothetical protein